MIYTNKCSFLPGFASLLTIVYRHRRLSDILFSKKHILWPLVKKTSRIR